MKTQKQTESTVEQLMHRWRTGHIELHEFFDEYRRWSYEVAQRGFPHFGEAADRLRQLRERLTDHFQKEDEISDELVAIGGQPTPEIDANRRQISADHVHLLNRLDDLIGQFGALEPPFESWQEGVEQVERFCDALEQHEEQESDCINWLKPKKG